MPNFWAFLLFVLIPHVCLAQQNTTNATEPQFFESIDQQEDLDLLIAANEEHAELPEEIRQAFSQDAETDTVKLIDVNAEQEQQKEAPRRKQPNFSLQKNSERRFLKFQLLYITIFRNLFAKIGFSFFA